MTSSAAAKAPDTKLDRHVLIVAGVVVLGSIMSILDITVVSVAQDTFQTELKTDQAGAAWSMTAYTLALATVIPLASWAATRFGTKKVYLASIVLFLIGSVLCALAWNIGSLIAFRAVQGLGGGLLMPVGMMILTKAAGPARIGSVMAVLGIPMLLGPIFGPILGGWLIQIASWHWIFLINVPIGIIALVYAWLVLKDDQTGEKPTIDYVGLLLLSPGLALFLYGVSSAGEAQISHGTFLTAKVVVPAVVGLAMMAAFVRHALRTDKPLLDLRLFRNRTLAVAVLTMVIFLTAFFGSALLYPQFFIGVRGESTLMAGLMLAPQGIGAMLTMPVAGRLTDKMGPGKFVLTGLVLITLGVAAWTQFDNTTSYWLIGGALLIQGMGMGMTMMPIMSSALATLRNKEVPDGSTLMNVVQQSSTSVGTAIISVLLFTALSKTEDGQLAIQFHRDENTKEASQHLYPFLLQRFERAPGTLPEESWFAAAAQAFHTPYLVATVLVACTLIPAFFLPRKKIESPLVEEEMDQPAHIGVH
ncbi:drug resistance efflux protein [Gordonia araii NBRC 100433]|uniref:Drug resistance efflux protein n=1 Tax=Gordonia araii NBRC 100433 TaxID=1073574 RepID=G7H749_9ACTN|nr:DHA2 family efflux MFS transporter permease subunit [Gordonia araii]NNG97670.1 DHA2 family efflux MFS transporter permease subunit [Gordonia araii NBRC 100433]GAB11674.1 drug resistance efflux protein [Gordonia araii NBRC 100433]